MGNCCATPSTTDEKKKGKNKPNLFSLDYGVSNPSANDGHKNTVLENPAGHEIERTYVLGKEMGREDFGITYMCTDKFTGEFFACKSISKKKPGTRVDTEDVRREVEIMKHMPPHPNIVSLKDTYEDGNAIHLVMELCEGGELFDRIVARGHYTERVAASVIQHFQQTTAGSSSFLLSVPSLHQPRSLVTSPATFMFFSLFHRFSTWILKKHIS